MTGARQPSMFDLIEAPSLGDLAATGRHPLSRKAWVDHLPGWVRGSEAVLDVLLGIDWRAERRVMYDDEVAVPRLLRWYGRGERLPHDVLTEARERLTAHYAEELGEPFVTATPPAARPTPTPWSRSCRSAPRAPCSYGPAAAGAASGSRSATATSS
jgi:hypothetical protein